MGCSWVSAATSSRNENGKFNTDDIGLSNEGSVKASEFLRDMYHKKVPALPDAAIDRANQHGISGRPDGGRQDCDDD